MKTLTEIKKAGLKNQQMIAVGLAILVVISLIAFHSSIAHIWSSATRQDSGGPFGNVDAFFAELFLLVAGTVLAALTIAGISFIAFGDEKGQKTGTVLLVLPASLLMAVMINKAGFMNHGPKPLTPAQQQEENLRHQRQYEQYQKERQEMVN